MNYFPLTEKNREDMLAFIGVDSVKDFFSDIPQKAAYYSLEEIAKALPENELIKKFKDLAGKNSYKQYLSFLGGGAYNHYIPQVVNYLSNKAEFLTPYTPYQAEVSQGSLQAMFEYQTMFTMLTGMDVSNASLYDGGTAVMEGLFLALRMNRKDKALIADSLHPEYKEIIETYIQNLGIELEYVSYDDKGHLDLGELKEKLDDKVGAVLFQSPNFFGQIEDSKAIAQLVSDHKKCSTVQAVAEAYSLPLLKSPGSLGIDIVCGESQSLGQSLSFGGPYVGFMAVKKGFIRQMPGRIVGETKDVDGKRGYVLTLSTREQHIKRARATSNICTNQAWCALKSAIFMSIMGKQGLREIALQNHYKAVYFVNELKKISGYTIRYKEGFFNELVVDVDNMTSIEFNNRMIEKSIIPGIPLSWFNKDDKKGILFNFTEMHSKEDIDKLISVMGELK